LFIVLLYVYPLKFLFNLSINDMIFGHPAADSVVRAVGWADLSVAFPDFARISHRASPTPGSAVSSASSLIAQCVALMVLSGSINCQNS